MSLIVLTEERIQSLIRQRKQVLGQGASCKVFLLEVKGDLCCLKVAKDHHFAGMFQKEFDILMELDGAAGAPIPLGKSFGFPALLTSFCGKTTFCQLSSMAPGDLDKFSAFELLVRDVQQLHKHGYVHNDIKENNVVVRRNADGSLKVSLIDYGLASKNGRTFKTNSDNDKPWMAPEACSGKPCKVKASLDVFSLGYILNNILKQCKARYPALEVLASMALSSDPAQRPSMAKLAKVIKSYTPLQEKKSKNTAVFRYLRKFCSRVLPCIYMTQEKNTVKPQSVFVKH